MYKPTNQIKISTLYGDKILLNTITGEFLSFNETGQLYWDAVTNFKNEEEALEFLSARIDASRDTLQAALYRFIEKLNKSQLIERNVK